MTKFVLISAMLLFVGCSIDGGENDTMSEEEYTELAAENTGTTSQAVMAWRCDARACDATCDRLILEGQNTRAERCINYCNRLRRCEVIDL